MSYSNIRAQHGAKESARRQESTPTHDSDAWHWGTGQAHAVVQQLKPGGDLWDTIKKSLGDQARHALHDTSLPLVLTPLRDSPSQTMSASTDGRLFCVCDQCRRRNFLVSTRTCLRTDQYRLAQGTELPARTHAAFAGRVQRGWLLPAPLVAAAAGGLLLTAHPAQVAGLPPYCKQRLL